MATFPLNLPYWLGGDPPTVDNFGFEIEDPAAPGLPDVWQIQITTTAVESFGFGVGSLPVAPYEPFEGGWSSNEDFVFAFTEPAEPSEREAAIFDSDLSDPPGVQSVEDFDNGWDNDAFLFETGSTDPADFDAGVPQTFEDFEEEWDDNENYLFSMGVTDAAEFDSAPETFEDFEQEWDDNESFDFTMGATDPAVFDPDGAAEEVENFEEVIPEFAVTTNPATNKVLATAHGLQNGERVTFRNEGGALPGGLVTGFTYRVINTAADDFEVSATVGGAAIDITDFGFGSHFAKADPEIYWTEIAATL